jgi:hypothetical protein
MDGVCCLIPKVALSESGNLGLTGATPLASSFGRAMREIILKAGADIDVLIDVVKLR